MKKIVIAASLMFAATAQASQPEYTMEIGVDVTPIVQEKLVLAKSGSSFESYVLENTAAAGQ